jgi:hypothetical protein
MSDVWASDTPVSLPEPVEISGPSVAMYGFVFTEKGLMHDINQAEHERLRVPTYAPEDATEWVYDDGH